MNNFINRRILLKGLGGACIAAPIFTSLLEKQARAQAAASTKRCIILFSYYGCITNNWFPQKLDGDLLESDLTGTSLAALGPYAKKLLMPRGMRTMNEWTASNKGAGQGRGQGNDSHTQCAGSALRPSSTRRRSASRWTTSWPSSSARRASRCTWTWPA
jgi:hypothetical protein